MKPSPTVRKLLKALITMLGMGIGAAVTALTLKIINWTHPGISVPIGSLVGLYIADCLFFGFLLFLVSERLVGLVIRFINYVSVKTERMPPERLIGASMGLIAGLAVAALWTTVVAFLGHSMFTIVFSTILFVVFGYLGLYIGLRRGGEVASWLNKSGKKTIHLHRKPETAGREKTKKPNRGKLIDSSALMDGRIQSILRLGFLEGDLMTTRQTVGELNGNAGSGDPLRQSRGQRGLEILKALQEKYGMTVIGGADDILQTASSGKLGLITCDAGLARQAEKAGVPVLNINELAGALRPVTLPGDEIRVRIIRNGKENGQGVAYLPDGTMLVVEGAGDLIGRECNAVITSSLQTNAGRMVFARLSSGT